MSTYRVYQRKTSGGIDKPLEKKELQRACSWVPGTPAKMFPVRRPSEINPVCDCRVVDDKARNEAPERQSGGAGTAGLRLYSAGLIDLNNSCDEWQDFDARFKAQEKVDYPGIEPTSFGRGSGIGEVGAMPQVSNFLRPGGSNEFSDDIEWPLADLPFTQLLTACTPADYQKESDQVVKDVDISVPGTYTEVLRSTTVNFSVSQESANSATCDGVAGTCSPVTIFVVERSTNEPDRSDHSQPNDTNITENMQKHTRMQADNSTTTESSGSHHGQQKAQEDVVYEMRAENFNKKAEKKRKINLKPKRKKHRPRVLDENRKPKKVAQPKTPKAVTPKRPSAKETLASKKRKYVRKSGQGVSISDEPLPKRRQARKKNENSCKRALDFDMNNPPTSVHQSENKVVDECVNSREQCEELIPNKWKKMMSKRRRRVFMPDLILGRAGIQMKGKRSGRRMISRSNLALLLALPICDQLPRLPGRKEETEGICQPEAMKKIMLTNYFHSRKVMESRRKMEMASVGLELGNNKLEGSPLENENCLFTAKHRGSQRIIQEERIDTAAQAYLQESENFGFTVESTRKVMESRRKMEMASVGLELSNNKYEESPLENENCLFTARHRGSQRVIQEERIDTAMQAYLQESENFGFTVNSTSSQEKLRAHSIDSLNQKVPAEPIYMSLVVSTTGSQEIPEKERTGSVIEGAESKEIILLTEKLKLLKIKGRVGRPKKQGPNIDNGTLVRYQEQPVRNRKRITAKVDLDPDTMRVWNRLMNVEDANEEEIDPEKEERWRRERDVFQGRIETFRARMHLILGDRRFKPWKGSVVDSVVGVYLTQNVSDNLSSSAYMSLAAKYPLQTNNNTADDMASNGEAYNLEGNMYFVTEPEPERSCESKNRIQPMDSVIEGKYIVEMDEGSSNVHLTDKADFASPSKTCSPSSYSGSNQLPVLENTILPRDLLYGGKISTSEEGQGNMQTRMNYGNQASTSGSINSDCGLIFLSDSYDPFERTISPIDQMHQAHHGNQGSISGRVNEPKVHHGFTSQSDSNDHLDLSGCSSNLENFTSHVQQAQNATSLSNKTQRGKGTGLKNNKTKNATPKQPKDWELYRKMYSSDVPTSSDHTDSVNWDAVRLAEPSEIAKAIKDRGQHNIIAGRIQDCLNRLVKLHNRIDLEWLRNAPPEIVKEYLLEIPGLGLKSVECVRLLSLQHIAFPVDTNVGRIAVRLGWVPLQPLPESLQIHLLEQYPLMDTIQKYLWPRLCNLDQRTLYELHYQLITFGKVFCTKKNPNCGVCPLRGECKHFASAFASARLALPGPSESRVAKIPHWAIPTVDVKPIPVTLLEASSHSDKGGLTNNCEPIVEMPSSPETQCTETSEEPDIEDLGTGEDEENIPVIKLQTRELMENVQLFMERNNMVLEDSGALALMVAEAASMPPPKLKSINRLRTEHLVYVLPDNHILLRGFERREPDDPCPYLLSIWTPGETLDSYEKPVKKCNSGESELCNDDTCSACNTIREKNAGIIRGTILIPCRTANRGRFPLNGTYFQVNEVFADHETSLHPMSVPRSMIAHLTRQIAFFGSSATSIFRALDLDEIQKCFWRGYICVRGFDRKYRAPRPLGRRFHTSPSKIGKPNEKWHDDE